ncbi:MAG TPA: PspA/IM30 family protein [Acidimicrobiales bacterium]|nr:PspA/IM30 family protein [Acidimicrobiales bacterium]
MGMLRRLLAIVRAKANSLLDKVEDPRDTLDLTYERQVENLQKVRRSLAVVATARKRIEIQAERLRQQATRLQGQARQALGQGREDLARQALARRAALDVQRADLDAHGAQIADQEKALVATATRLTTQVAAFRTRKESLKATYSAAEAQVRVGQAVLGISAQAGEAGAALDRAADKVAQAQARAAAVDELLASGALPLLGSSPDDIQARLDRAGAAGQVERQLAAVRAELAGEPAPGVARPALDMRTPGAALPGLPSIASPIPDTPHEVTT